MRISRHIRNWRCGKMQSAPFTVTASGEAGLQKPWRSLLLPAFLRTQDTPLSLWQDWKRVKYKLVIAPECSQKFIWKEKKARWNSHFCPWFSQSHSISEGSLGSVVHSQWSSSPGRFCFFFFFLSPPVSEELKLWLKTGTLNTNKII